MKRTRFLDSLRNRFPAVPRLSPVAAGAPVHFATSGGGGGGDFDDPDDDYFDDDIPEEPAPQRRRNDERRATAARRRTVQTDPDDRYWTDYLRIALPVIGLLLVIAVFWYWAQQLIDDNGTETPATEPPGVAELTDTTPEATEPPATPPQEQPAQESTVENPLQQAFPTPTPTEATAGDATDDTADGDGTGTDNQAQEDPVEEQPASGGIAPDAVVVVTDDVNLRSAPTAAEDNVVTVLSAGSELTVLLGPEESEDYVWWNVVDNATGDEGWVVEDFIEPAE